MHVANLGEGFLSVTGNGAADSYFDYQAYDVLGSGGWTKADAQFVSNVDSSNCNAFDLCGTADLKTKVPEPGALALIGIGLVGFASSIRRKKKFS